MDFGTAHDFITRHVVFKLFYWKVVVLGSVTGVFLVQPSSHFRPWYSVFWPRILVHVKEVLGFDFGRGSVSLCERGFEFRV